MRHIRVNTELGKLTIIALQWWQTIVGVSYELLRNTEENIDYTGETWFTSIREFLSKLKGTLKIPLIQQGLPQILRKNDRVLMDDIAHQSISKRERIQFNNVRLWMRVYCLSEMSTADGRNISLIAIVSCNFSFFWRYAIYYCNSIITGH